MLAHRASHWLVLVTCWRCQRRGIFIATFPRDGHSPTGQQLPLDTQCSSFDLSVAPDADAALTPTSLPAPENLPVSLGDVDAMRRFLLSFNGDFRALFGGDAG